MGIRKIDISKLTPSDRTVGPKPEIGFVPIDKLVIDESYQRAIEQRGLKNIEKIAHHFDWAKFSPLMVARRADGTFAIIDGQHRAHAAALCGIKEVPALISDLSAEKQASAFSWINGTVTALTPNQIFKAALAAFEPWAVQCDAVVTRAGCKLMTYTANSASKKPGEIYPIATVRRFVDAGQSQYLAAVLEGVRTSIFSEDIRYYNSFGIKTLTPAAIETGITRPEIISGFLEVNDLDNIERRVRRIMEQPEYHRKPFGPLFASSVLTLLKNYAGQADTGEVAA